VLYADSGCLSEMWNQVQCAGQRGGETSAVPMRRNCCDSCFEPAVGTGTGTGTGDRGEIFQACE